MSKIGPPSVGEEGGDVAVFERDTFYIRLVSREAAQTAILRNRNGI